MWFSQSDSNDCLFYIMPLVLEMDKGKLNKVEWNDQWKIIMNQNIRYV